MITVQCRRYIYFVCIFYSKKLLYLILPCSMHVLRKSCAPPGLDHSTENSVPKLFWFLCHSTKNLVFGWEPALCWNMSMGMFPWFLFLSQWSMRSSVPEAGGTLLCRYTSWRLDILDWFRQSDGGGHLHFPLLELRILPKARVSVPKLWYEAQMVAIVVNYPWLQYKRCCVQCYIISYRYNYMYVPRICCIKTNVAKLYWCSAASSHFWLHQNCCVFQLRPGRPCFGTTANPNMALPYSQITPHMDVGPPLTSLLELPRICWNQIPARCTRHAKKEHGENVSGMLLSCCIKPEGPAWQNNLWNWWFSLAISDLRELAIVFGCLNLLFCPQGEPPLHVNKANGVMFVVRYSRDCVPLFWDVKCCKYLKLFRKSSQVRCFCTKPVRLRWTSPNCKWNITTPSLVNWVNPRCG